MLAVIPRALQPQVDNPGSPRPACSHQAESDRTILKKGVSHMTNYRKPEVSVLGTADKVIQNFTGKMSNINLDSDHVTQDVNAAYDLDE
jgi:hypothetical protein